jgi:hypothetical protein
VLELDIARLRELSRTLLAPIQEILAATLPDFIEERLDDDDVRERIVSAVDAALVSQQPVARAIPDAVRRRIIRRLLDLALDEILLPA